jgi:hypothetical protein
VKTVWGGVLGLQEEDICFSAKPDFRNRDQVLFKPSFSSRKLGISGYKAEGGAQVF